MIVQISSRIHIKNCRGGWGVQVYDGQVFRRRSRHQTLYGARMAARAIREGMRT